MALTASRRRRIAPLALALLVGGTLGWVQPGSPSRPVRAQAAAANESRQTGAARAARLLPALVERASAAVPKPVVEIRDGAPGGTTTPAAAPTGATSGGVDVTPHAASRTYAGANHVWIPALGMSYEVTPFPCPRKRPPDNLMYRWDCAKENNVYLLGHAYSVMKALHDAYVSGRLEVGMVAIYADASGRIRAYAVREWRVVDPAEGVRWAIARQHVASMTLQTCVGKNDRWRLNVRLVALDATPISRSVIRGSAWR